MANDLVPGSLSAIAQKTGMSLAESFLSADVIILVDVSGSMGSYDSRGSQRRYDVACEELANLQNSHPGKVAVVAFSDSPSFCPSGVPVFLAGGTDLAAGLRFVKPADGTVKFIVISDGMPDDAADAINVAKSFVSNINTVYVGPETELSGANFLRKLATASGGQYATAKEANKLAESVEKLMLGAGQ